MSSRNNLSAEGWLRGESWTATMSSRCRNNLSAEGWLRGEYFVGEGLAPLSQQPFG